MNNNFNRFQPNTSILDIDSVSSIKLTKAHKNRNQEQIRVHTAARLGLSEAEEEEG